MTDSIKKSRPNRVEGLGSANIRLFISDTSAMEFIQQQATKHNVSMSTLANMLIIRTLHQRKKVEKFLDQYYKNKEGRKVTKSDTFFFENLAFKYYEVQIIANLVDLIKLDSVEGNYEAILEGLGETYHGRKRIITVLSRMSNMGFLIKNKYGVKDYTYTLHMNAIRLVNQAIDEGYLDEF